MNKVICTLVMVMSLMGCSGKPAATGPAITGNLSYQRPVELGKDSEVMLSLTDVSIADGPALQIATVSIKDVQALPYQYSLNYDPALINEQHRYTVDVRITSKGVLRYSTDTAYQVLTQGHGAQRDLTVVAVGSNEATALITPQTDTSIFNAELRTTNDVTLYKAGLQQGYILWLEEERSNGTPQPLHARYELKGALITHYTDSSPLEVTFDERGRPIAIVKEKQSLKVTEQMDAINAIRNRAALLRSHALAASEARAHRQATGG